MKKYLLLCIEIEETAAKTYRQLSESTNLPTNLKVVMQVLADDEDQHAMQLRFALRLPAGSIVLDKKFDRAPVESLLARAKALLERTRQKDFDAKLAIEMGIELEQDFCQAHIGNCMEFHDQSMKKMFAALAQDDKAHMQKLLDAKAKYL